MVPNSARSKDHFFLVRGASSCCAGQSERLRICQWVDWSHRRPAVAAYQLSPTSGAILYLHSENGLGLARLARWAGEFAAASFVRLSGPSGLAQPPLPPPLSSTPWPLFLTNTFKAAAAPTFLSSFFILPVLAIFGLVLVWTSLNLWNCLPIYLLFWTLPISANIESITVLDWAPHSTLWT